MDTSVRPARARTHPRWSTCTSGGRALGGSLRPGRTTSKPFIAAGDPVYDVMKRGSGKQPVATTMAFVRLLKDLMKDKEIGCAVRADHPGRGPHVRAGRPVPDAKIYSPHGQTYMLGRPRADAVATRSRRPGVILHEGINEAGLGRRRSPRSGTSYATHGEPMIPIYIFYSMFGFQRTGDAFWAAADQMARGFVLGATAGRTTLNGEGLQHEDGHSPLLASTNPAVVAYDPAFGFEIGHIVQDGAAPDVRRAARGRLLLPDPSTTSRTSQPAEPEGVDVEGILAACTCTPRRRGATGRGRSCSPPASRCRGRCEAQELLADDWGVAGRRLVGDLLERAAPRRRSRPTSTTSCTRTTSRAAPYVTDRLDGAPGPGRRGVGLHARGAGPDRAVGARRLRSLGTDGFGHVRHPRRAAPALQGRRRVDRGAGADDARQARRGQAARRCARRSTVPAGRRQRAPTAETEGGTE